MLKIALLLLCGLFSRHRDCPTCHRPEPAPAKQVQVPSHEEIIKTAESTPLKEANGLTVAEWDLLNRMNAERSARKLPPVKINKTLQRCARYRNPIMHDGNAHTPNGVSCSASISRAGYKWRGCSEIFDSWADNPADAIRDWKHSPGHWGAIIGNWKECGVAFKGNNATVIFANPR